MTHRELALLQALNIASTIYRRKGHDFEATAVQITQVGNHDERIQSEYGMHFDTLQVGAMLRGLRQGPPRRWEPLVEKVDSRRWRLTSAGCRVLGA